MLNNKITTIVLMGIIVVAFIAGALLYPQLPARIASHWNATGEVDGYMQKFWGIFLLPLIMLGMFALYIVIPLIDPLKNNIQSFRKYYNALWIILEAFFLYIFVLTIAWNFGYRFNFTTAIVPAFAVLWFFMGSFLKNIKRNWFVGIRTPWTMTSDVVWDKTHKLGGKLFQASAVISLLGLFFGGLVPIFAIIIPVLVSAVVAIVYSYIEFKKLKN
jgi:uncharacterized membrane protein